MLLHLISSKNIKSKLNFLKINLFLVIFFTILYYLDGIYYRNDNNLENNSILDCFYYSLVTQTTVGYGDIIANDIGCMKQITIMQLLSIFFTLSFH